MKIRVLGCSGAIARDCRTTSFLVNHDLLIDAGTGVGDLPLAELVQIDHVLLSHSHLDHIAAQPLLLDAVCSQRRRAVQVHALPATLQALRQHIFNGTIWPDFTRIECAPGEPFVRLCPLQLGQQFSLGGVAIEVLPAVHTVPTVGYALHDSAAGASAPRWVYSGDTASNPALWQRINQLPVQALVIETAFSAQEAQLACLAQHLSPATLAQELAQIAPGRRYPIYISHTKPAQTGLIMDEVRQQDSAAADGSSHDIRWLQIGYKWQW